MKRVLWIAVLIALLTPAVHASVSVGTAQGGHLEDGFELPENNVWIRFYRKVKDRGSNHATLELAALMARASRVVNQAVGGSLLTIGDCSSESGGDIRGHRSHNSGGDVDILFYVVDDRGRWMPVDFINLMNRDVPARKASPNFLMSSGIGGWFEPWLPVRTPTFNTFLYPTPCGR